MNVTDAECIDFLLEAKSASAGELAKAARLSTGAMTAAIDRFERAGFVTRERDTDDRRKVLVKPVMAKIKKFIPLYESFVAEIQKIFATYSTEEIEFLFRHNEQMIAIYEGEIKKLEDNST